MVRPTGDLVINTLRAVRPLTSTQQVVEQIRQLIQGGRLGPGAKLPPVRDLAQGFGVSASTIREAVQVLSALRLVEVRQGRGIFVASPRDDSRDPASWLPWLQAHREDVLALLEVREVLERKSASLAARAVAADPARARDSLDLLERNVREMAAAARVQDVAALERLDIAFHGLIAELGGNPYLIYLSGSINHIFADRRAVMALPGRPRRSVAQHLGILEAIRAGDVTGAADRMSKHLESTIASVRALRGAGTGAGGPGHDLRTRAAVPGKGRSRAG
ncbi:MAG: FCD domain-containing protein [Armatimonadota bacterium]|nr:FCD domain-containing protein [Armatimonadota bacterium]MDR7485665.1 FCD domain-containing protein [Armatimonadota bacterium]MDR7534298.1 FCD domain-containing protein [Armatimonadota bacterium]MDR7535910.1 FCD domain-containing protein [Armatimonadota bacterium]